MTPLYDSNKIEFTKCVVESDTSDRVAQDGQWLTIEIKRMFDTSLITSRGRDLDATLGFHMDPSEGAKTSVRIRLGYFDTAVSEVLHRAIGEIKLGERVHISFEFDPRLLLDESSAAFSSTQQDQIVFIDLKFEIRLVQIEDSPNPKYGWPIYKLGSYKFKFQK